MHGFYKGGYKMAKKTGLGKGLDALFSDTIKKDGDEETFEGEVVKQIKNNSERIVFKRSGEKYSDILNEICKDAINNALF